MQQWPRQRSTNQIEEFVKTTRFEKMTIVLYLTNQARHPRQSISEGIVKIRTSGEVYYGLPQIDNQKQARNSETKSAMKKNIPNPHGMLASDG